jgi:transcription elongation GreA/GreB family factor
MDKKKILDTLLNDLKSNLDALVDAALIAKEAATGEESKAENKYDTRGLEASYLAGAQAKRAEELRVAIFKLQKINLRSFSQDDAVGITAIVTVIVDGATKKDFFVLPSVGGHKVVAEGRTFHVITPESPVGSLFVGKKIKDFLQVEINKKVFEYEISNIY